MWRITFPKFEPDWSKLKFDATFDLLLDLFFPLAPCGGSLSPCLRPIGATWNLMRPLTPSDLLLCMFVRLAPCGGSLCPSLSPIRVPWNLTRPLTSIDLFLVKCFSDSPRVEDHFPQVWARSEQVEIWPDLSPRATSFSSCFQLAPCGESLSASLSPIVAS